MEGGIKEMGFLSYIRSVSDENKKQKLLTAAYNRDKAALGLPYERWCMSGVTKKDFDSYAPTYALRKDYLSYDVSVLIYRMIQSKDPHSLSKDLQEVKFHDFREWLIHTTEGNKVLSESHKIIEQRLPKDLNYHDLKRESLSPYRHLERLFIVGLVVSLVSILGFLLYRTII